MTSRSCWEDRFARPSVRALLSGLDTEQHALVLYARNGLASLPRMREEIAWQGIPWRWCFVFRSEEDGQRPFAFLVPQPQKPSLAVPLESDIVSELPLRKLPKHIRDGLLNAPMVGDVRWCQWDLAAKSQIDDILHLARLKLAEPGGTEA